MLRLKYTGAAKISASSPDVASFSLLPLAKRSNSSPFALLEALKSYSDILYSNTLFLGNQRTVIMEHSQKHAFIQNDTVTDPNLKYSLKGIMYLRE